LAPPAEQPRPEHRHRDQQVEPGVPHEREHHPRVETEVRWRDAERQVVPDALGVTQAELVADERTVVVGEQVDAVETEPYCALLW
jgi:hypothetical protein